MKRDGPPLWTRIVLDSRPVVHLCAGLVGVAAAFVLDLLGLPYVPILTAATVVVFVAAIVTQWRHTRKRR